MMFTLLVVDDELDKRERAYRDVLEGGGHFKLLFAGTPSEFLGHVRRQPIDGCLADLVLDHWKGFPLPRVLEELDGKCPVMIVSRRWKCFDDKEMQTVILSKYRTPVRMLLSFCDFDDPIDKDKDKTWTERLSSRQNALYWDILMALKAHHNQAGNYERKSECHLLHISDIQFGDPDRANGFLGEHAIEKAIRRENITPDFLVLSGDMAYSGDPKEFVEARQWVQGLARLLWGESERLDRVLVAPGNHDMNYRVIEVSNNDIDIKRGTLVPASVAHEGYERLGLVSYWEFCESVSSNTPPNSKKGWNMVCNRFFHAGLQFTLLDTVQATSLRYPKRFRVSPEAMKQLIADHGSSAATDDGLWRICVGHNGLVPRLGSQEVVENGDDVANFMAQLSVDIYLHGHGHRFSATQVEANERRGIAGMVQVMTPSLTMRSSHQDAQRGFSVVSLYNDGDDTRRVEVCPFEVVDSDVRPFSQDLRPSYRMPKRCEVKSKR